MTDQNQSGAPPQPQAGQAAPKTEVEIRREKQDQLSNLLVQYKDSIKNALPSMLTAERMIRVVLSTVSKTPGLLDCTKHSFMGCVLTCAQLGLTPDGILGEAHLIPFKNKKKGITEATVIIGYKGLITLAMRTGLVKSIQARAVYQGDEWEYEFGLDEKLKHKPKGITDPSKITHFYAVIRMNNGAQSFDVMTREAVEAIRNESANYKFAQFKNDTIWGKHFAEMGCKTVIRKMSKTIPLSPEYNKAVALDEQQEFGLQNMKLQVLDDLATKEDMEGAVYADEIEDEKAGDDKVRQDEVDERKRKADEATQATLDRLKEVTEKSGTKKK